MTRFTRRSSTICKPSTNVLLVLGTCATIVIMSIVTWIIVGVVALLIFKFIFKPLFKVFAFAALAIAVWWFWSNGGF